jgi:hypothetical protein
MAKNVIRLAGIAVVLTIAVAAAALPRSTTLPQLFPELADMPETNGVAIGIGWMGLSRLSPITAGYFLELHGDQFEGPGFFQVAKAPGEKRAIAVPRDIVRAFLTAVNNVPVVEGEYQARIEHTDDYPSLDVQVSIKQVSIKQELLRIGSQSQQRQPKSGNYPDRTPWYVDYRKRSFVVTATDLDQAFGALEPYLQDEKVIDELVKKYGDVLQ